MEYYQNLMKWKNWKNWKNISPLRSLQDWAKEYSSWPGVNLCSQSIMRNMKMRLGRNKNFKQEMKIHHMRSLIVLPCGVSLQDPVYNVFACNSPLVWISIPYHSLRNSIGGSILFKLDNIVYQNSTEFDFIILFTVWHLYTNESGSFTRREMWITLGVFYISDF